MTYTGDLESCLTDQFESGNVSVPASDGGFTGATNTCYELTIDRTTTSLVTFDLNTMIGTDVSSPTVDPASSFDGNSSGGH